MLAADAQGWWTVAQDGPAQGGGRDGLEDVREADVPVCAGRAPRPLPVASPRWREHGRQRRRYVRAEDAARVSTAIQDWRSLHPPAYRLRQELAALRRLTRELEV